MVELLIAQDGIARAALINTKILRRSISPLIPIEVDTGSHKSSETSTTGTESTDEINLISPHFVLEEITTVLGEAIYKAWTNRM